jgi:hypothetical protein
LRIDQEIAGKRVVFTRNWFTGRARLFVDGVGVTLQTPWDAATHFSLTSNRKWDCQVDEHTLLIEKIRPILLAGARPHTYRLYLNGNLVLERHGY